MSLDQTKQSLQGKKDFDGKENVCNWCGSDEIESKGSVFGCDLDHDVFQCKACGQYTWHHIHWSICWKNPDGSYLGY